MWPRVIPLQLVRSLMADPDDLLYIMLYLLLDLYSFANVRLVLHDE